MYKQDGDRGRSLQHLLANYNRDENLSLEHLDQLEAQLEGAEARISADTIYAQRSESLRKSGKWLQAYSVLKRGLSRKPNSITLQNERYFLYADIDTALANCLHSDVSLPIIENLYAVLRKEGVLSIPRQVRYLDHLLSHQRISEAVKLALPLTRLVPAALCLRASVEQIVLEVPHPDLLQFLRLQPPQIGSAFATRELSLSDVWVLQDKMIAIQTALRGDVALHLIAKQINEIIGDDKEQTLNTELKEFYCLKATVDERQGNHFEAMLMFKSLVEMDPANIKFRQKLDYSFALLCQDISAQIERQKLECDIIKLYPVLREIGILPYKIIGGYAMARARQGDSAEAKRSIEDLMSLNDLDADYIGVAQQVAEALNDKQWLSQLNEQMRQVAQSRPWDIELNMEISKSA
jgi:hypothetical protein